MSSSIATVIRADSIDARSTPQDSQETWRCLVLITFYTVGGLLEAAALARHCATPHNKTRAETMRSQPRDVPG